MGEAASGRLQTRLLSPLSLSLESTRRQVPFPNLIRVRRPGGQSVICLLLGSQPPLRFSCGPPLSAPVSFPALSCTPHCPLFSAWGICAHSVVPPCSSCRDQTGQCFASGNQRHRSELWLPSCTVWKHCLHFDSLDTQRKDPTPTCRQFSLAHAWQALRIFRLGMDCRKCMGPRTSGCSSINLQHKSELWDAVVAPTLDR